MAKILTDAELGIIVWNATHDPGVIDDGDSYAHFLEDLAELVCSHFGGEPGTVHRPDADDLDWTVGIRHNECVPSDGGVFKDFDTDVSWEDDVETDNHDKTN